MLVLGVAPGLLNTLFKMAVGSNDRELDTGAESKELSCPGRVNVVDPPSFMFPLLKRETKEDSAADAGSTPSGTPASEVIMPVARLFVNDEVLPPRRASPPVNVVIKF